MSSWYSGWFSSDKDKKETPEVEIVDGGNGESKVEPAPAETEERKGLFKQLSSYIGKDITSMISLPVWIFEPHSFLQIMCEPLQFEELLKKASETNDPYNQLAYLAAFLTAGYSCASRTKKPFNPILGETYEFLAKDDRWKFFAEQVSHHPPMGVAEATSENYKLHIEMRLKTKLRPNSAEATVAGECFFINNRTGHVITWNHLDTCANNVIIGGMWVDHYGDLVIVNNTTGDQCKLTFTRSGFFGAGRYEINGKVMDKDGNAKLKLSGKWNEVVYCAKIQADGTETAPIVLWKRPPPPQNKWLWTPFNEEMNAMTPEYEAQLPRTDSRIRSDRRELEKGNVDLAGKEKVRLEEKQRAERRDRETKNEEYVPKYFKQTEKDGKEQWEYIGQYWEERQDRQTK